MLFTVDKTQPPTVVISECEAGALIQNGERHMLYFYNSRQIFFLPTGLEGSGLENGNCEKLFPSPMRTCCPKKTKERRAYTFSK